MERVITVTLHKDTAGNYSLSIHPLTVIVSVIDEENANVNVRWILNEDPANPDFPNARKLTATFSQVPTPFTLTSSGEPLPAAENYTTPASGSGAEVATAPVQESAVGGRENDIAIYKYNVSVETNDNKTITLDPDVKVRRRKITRDTILGH